MAHVTSLSSDVVRDLQLGHLAAEELDLARMPICRAQAIALHAPKHILLQIRKGARGDGVLPWKEWAHARFNKDIIASTQHLGQIVARSAQFYLMLLLEKREDEAQEPPVEMKFETAQGIQLEGVGNQRVADVAAAVSTEVSLNSSTVRLRAVPTEARAQDPALSCFVSVATDNTSGAVEAASAACRLRTPRELRLLAVDSLARLAHRISLEELPDELADLVVARFIEQLSDWSGLDITHWPPFNAAAIAVAATSLQLLQIRRGCRGERTLPWAEITRLRFGSDAIQRCGSVARNLSGCDLFYLVLLRDSHQRNRESPLLLTRYPVPASVFTT